MAFLLFSPEPFLGPVFRQIYAQLLEYTQRWTLARHP
jgi:hypothetical protein